MLWASIPGRNERAGAGVREHALPTGAMHLVFRIGGPRLRVFDSTLDDSGHELAGAVIGGARSSFYIRDASVPVASVGAMLRPGAARPLFGAGAAELSSRHTPLDDVWGQSAAHLHERLAESDSAQQRLDLFEAELLRRLPRVCGLHPAIADALGRFASDDDVASAVERSGYSHRHFVSLFRDEVGLSPKLYSRVRRFQRAIELARCGTCTLTDIASEIGYADQAHLNRDFREFAGLTPGEYRAINPAAPNHVRLPAPA